ncbi:Uma2 family endonuclease [Bacillus mangrovi]|uniref:Uma2 family endonuclease n=1 Tax=Metabacillus mangrovi TaxID=1491830 RepID=A0A7X2S7X2_9BACI|nr:Uma2 family endonuclease [Metabacillus mangrovi]MTH54925.1 Uma2 family endonuclease [Metabacillus mangrovi]
MSGLTIEEYFQKRNQSDDLMEYIQGEICFLPSPSTVHQRISGRLFIQLLPLAASKDCEVFYAPLDVELAKGEAVVIPDITVICDKSGLGEQRYTGVPSLITEIISPSNQSHDLVTKLNLYMQYGVKEYWIVNPLLQTIQLYTLADQNQYSLKDVVKEKGTIQSGLFGTFSVNAEALFQ